VIEAKPDDFTIIRNKKLLGCLASSIGYSGGTVRLVGKGTSLWRPHREHYGQFGRMWWELVPSEKSIRKFPALKGWTMRIFDG